MKLIKLAAIAVNQIVGDWQGNRERIKAAIYWTRAQKSNVILLPELAISGYGCEDLYNAPYFADYALRSLLTLTDFILPSELICVGVPIKFGNKLYNCAALLSDKKILALVPKHFLANDGLHYETRWFAANERGFISSVNNIPFGDLIVDWQGFKIGIEICEDAWVADRPSVKNCSAGVDIVLCPSASHFAFGKYETRKQIFKEGSRSAGTTVAYANLLGLESGRVIFDGDVGIFSLGKTLAVNGRFSLEKFSGVTATIDVESCRQHRQKVLGFSNSNDTHLLINRNIEIENEIAANNKFVAVAETKSLKPLSNFEEFSLAVSLGLIDYLTKTSTKGVVLSLSGGADSSSVAILVWIAVCRLWQELGAEQIKRLWPNWKELQTINSRNNLMELFLTSVYQRSDQSSKETLISAQELAACLKAKFILIDIQPLVNSYINEVSNKLNEAFSWDNDDLALQNIQARVRAPSVWLIANKKGSLLLTTGNRSEAAVGYLTMDGDTCGGLNIIGGVSKQFILNWLQFIADQGFNCEKIDAISHVLNLKPSAELRPIDKAQTDEEDLMPYVLLDQIERLAICEQRSPKDVLAILLANTQYPKEVLTNNIKKFYLLWSKNQWKRERLAVTFHIDNYNVDSRSWCRFPVISSGFIEELKDLENN